MSRSQDPHVELASREDLPAAARAKPGDVRAQIAAAYACDREGDEATAVGFYDAAWRLHVPADERAEFLIGYGSTLNNVGRLEESERVLRTAIDEADDPRAARAFLALTLHASGRSSEAIGQLIELLVDGAQSTTSLARYRASLTHYALALRGTEMGIRRGGE